MRGIPFVIAAVLVLGACRGEQPVQQRPAASHDAMVSAMAGNYIWDCTMRNEEGTEEWKFVLQRQKRRSSPETFLVEAGVEFDQRVEVKRDGAALIYVMKDKGEILVASDGEGFGSGPRHYRAGPSHARATKYPTGRCTRGAA